MYKNNFQNEDDKGLKYESNLKKYFCTVTPFSKYFALMLFIVLPFLGFWVGLNYRSVSNNIVVPGIGSYVFDQNNREPTENIEKFFGAIKSISSNEVNTYTAHVIGLKKEREEIRPPDDLLIKYMYIPISNEGAEDRLLVLDPNAEVYLFRYQGNSGGDLHKVDVHTLVDVFNGNIEEYYYYNLPSDIQPFEIEVVGDVIKKISQIYIE